MSRRDEQPSRPHPLMGACLVVVVSPAMHVAFAGEVIEIIKTSARYGDAMLVEGFPRRDGKPSSSRLISISEIAAVRDGINVLLFPGPFDTAEWLRAHWPDSAEHYELDFEPCEDGGLA